MNEFSQYESVVLLHMTNGVHYIFVR